VCVVQRRIPRYANSVLWKMWKKAVLAWFKYIATKFHGVSKENHEIESNLLLG
jgi:hypothetical protein